MKILILGLGNELLADDGVGILAARALAERLAGRAEVVECSMHGIALLDYFIDYDRAVIVDAIQTAGGVPGTIFAMTPGDLDAVAAPSPHYAGLPEMLTLAAELELDFPAEIRIFAMEVADPYTIGQSISEPVRRALPELVSRVEACVQTWEKELCYAIA